MNLLKNSLILLGSVSLFLLAACSGQNQAANSGSSANQTTTETASKTTTAAKDAEKHSEGDGHDHSKDGEKHSEGDGHDHSKDGEKHSAGDGHDHSKDGQGGHSHKGQVVELGKYHVEFIADTHKNGNHLDIFVNDEQDKQVTDAKITAQIQLPDGSSKTLEIPYKADEKHYDVLLPDTAPGEYKVVLQTEINGEKFNGRFSFKR
jgi:hypothetical protein